MVSGNYQKPQKTKTPTVHSMSARYPYARGGLLLEGNMEKKHEQELMVLQKQQQELLRQVQDCAIVNRETFDRASDYTKSIKILWKQFSDLKDFFDRF